MKIAIDARPAQIKKTTGIELFVIRLLDNWSLKSSALAFSRKRLDINNPNITFKILHSFNDGAWFHIQLPLTLLKNKITLFVSTTSLLPYYLSKKIKTLVIVYDLGYKYFPDAYTKKELSILQNRTDKSIKRADKIITISESTKKDLIKFFNINTNRIKVVPLGFDYINKLDPINDLTLSSPSIVMIGTGYGRKNFQILNPTLKILHKKFDIRPTIYIAGKKTAQVIKILKEFTPVIRSQIKYLGYVSNEQKAWLLSKADLFFFPSLYEGFGIPVLEAMQQGCPVVCSNTSSLPEVVGNAALTIDPSSEKSCAEGIFKVLTDFKLKEELVKNGKIRIKIFNWKKTSDLFENLLQEWA